MFWTFGFPVVLAVALGIAFRNQPPEPVHVAVEAGPRRRADPRGARRRQR